jgi:hypothetical protein
MYFAIRARASLTLNGTQYPLATRDLASSKKGKGRRSTGLIAGGAGLGMLVGGVATGGTSHWPSTHSPTCTTSGPHLNRASYSGISWRSLLLSGWPVSPRAIFVRNMNCCVQANALIELGLGTDLRISPHKRPRVQEKVVAGLSPTRKFQVRQQVAAGVDQLVVSEWAVIRQQPESGATIRPR